MKPLRRTDNFVLMEIDPLNIHAAKPKCRSCGAPILWAETVKGRRIPIDPLPAHDGNIRLEQRGALPPLAIVLTGQIENNTQRFRSHFASCPNAAQHRRTK